MIGERDLHARFVLSNLRFIESILAVRAFDWMKKSVSTVLFGCYERFSLTELL